MSKRGRALPDALAVLMNGRLVGQVRRTGSRLDFVYDGDWRLYGPVIPLSLSMPLSGSRYGHAVVSNWLWGLLPENERTLQRIASREEVSATNVFALLWVLGEDCPGAVQFVEPDRVSALVQGGDILWLDEVEIGARLAQVRQDFSAGRAPDEGQFSLAGAQPKTALCRIDGRWGIPSGRIPTTHILKPPITDLDGHTENEVFCLTLANAVTLPAARAEVRDFAGETAIVVERYDRVAASDGTLIRIHQEDLCQSMGLHPVGKYEKEGGPGIKRIMETLRTGSTMPDVDRRRFMEATAFNVLIGGTDAHAKNYSVLFGPKRVRLAPLYDVASYLPYAERWADVRMPMKVGGHYKYADVQRRHWERMAADCRFPADEAVAIVAGLIGRLPDAASQTAAALRASGVDHPVVGKLTDLIARHCATVARQWGLGTAPPSMSD